MSTKRGLKPRPLRMVWVRCQGDNENSPCRTKGPVVAVLSRNEAGEWTPRADNVAESRTLLDGNAPVPERFQSLLQQHGALRKPSHRGHIQIICELCGIKGSWKADRVDVVLDEIWTVAARERLVADSHGTFTVPLRTLSMRLG